MNTESVSYWFRIFHPYYYLTQKMHYDYNLILNNKNYYYSLLGHDAL
jgi:hypothetical protein